MRVELVLALGMALMPSPVRAQSLSEAFDREARVLAAERDALAKALSEARKSQGVAKEALSVSIESLGAELVRLRSENRRRETALPARERLRDARAQARALEQLEGQIDGWLELHGGEAGGGIDAALSRVLARGGLKTLAAQTVFAGDGAGQTRPVTRLGRVGAVADGVPLVPVGDAYQTADVPTTREETADGVIQTVVLYDPDEPQVVDRGGAAAWLRAGGPLLWPILLLAALAVLVVLERTVRLMTVHLAWRRWRAHLSRHEAQHDWEAATQSALDQSPRWVVQPFIEILANRESPLTKVEERATEALLKIRPQLQRRLSVLGVTAAVAPLLGLLGTVTGMISTFSAITTHGTGDPRLLSDGISEALITTQLGLTVAVPALLLHTGLLRWSSAIFVQIEDACLGLLHHLEDLDLPREGHLHHEHARHHG